MVGQQLDSFGPSQEEQGQGDIPLSTDCGLTTTTTTTSRRYSSLCFFCVFRGHKLKIQVHESAEGREQSEGVGVQVESGGLELKGDISGASSEGFVPGESKGGRAREGRDKFRTGVEGEAPLLLLLLLLLLLRYLLLTVV